MSKLLALVEIDLWTEEPPRVSFKRVERETETSVYCRNLHPVKNRTSPRVTVGPYNKRYLGQLYAPRPGARRGRILIEETDFIRETPEYRHLVIRMLDELQAELITAETQLAEVERGLEHG